MIVYNHGRRWFTKKEDAAAWRRQIANPAPVIKIEVKDRNDLMNLLNALCDPPAPKVPLPAPSTPDLVNRAYVRVDTSIPDCVPQFLRKDWSVS